MSLRDWRARMNATPPPAKMPSSTAARVACSASSSIQTLLYSVNVQQSRGGLSSNKLTFACHWYIGLRARQHHPINNTAPPWTPDGIRQRHDTSINNTAPPYAPDPSIEQRVPSMARGKAHPINNTAPP